MARVCRVRLSLVHVAGVALRAAADCTIDHNRITRTPRYAIQADSFYVGVGQPNTQLMSSGNIVEFNILDDTNRMTTDTGAIEMLGSGDPNVICKLRRRLMDGCFAAA
jgi:hypothetical protein